MPNAVLSSASHDLIMTAALFALIGAIIAMMMFALGLFYGMRIEDKYDLLDQHNYHRRQGRSREK